MAATVGKETLRSILGVAVLSTRWIVRQPTWLLQDALLLAAFTIMLWAWGGMEAAKTVIIAWLIVSAWGSGINIVGQEIGWSRVIGTLYMYIASPITPRRYLLGVTLGHLAVELPISLAIVILIAHAMNAYELVPAALMASILLMPTSMLLGLSVAMRVKKTTNISAILNPLSMIPIMLSPVFYPIKALPQLLQPVALIVPPAAAAELARAAINYYNTYTTTEPLVVLIAWSIAAIILAKYSIKWGHE